MGEVSTAEAVLFTGFAITIVAYIVWKLKNRAGRDGFFSKDQRDRRREK